MSIFSYEGLVFTMCAGFDDYVLRVIRMSMLVLSLKAVVNHKSNIKFVFGIYNDHFYQVDIALL